MYLLVLATFVMLISLFNITFDFLFIHLECTWMQYIENNFTSFKRCAYWIVYSFLERPMFKVLHKLNILPV